MSVSSAFISKYYINLQKSKVIQSYLYFYQYIICNGTKRNMLMFVITMVLYNTWNHIGMMSIICATICICEIKYIGNFIIPFIIWQWRNYGIFFFKVMCMYFYEKSESIEPVKTYDLWPKQQTISRKITVLVFIAVYEILKTF